MTHKPFRTSTALVATLSLLLPQGALVPAARAQETVLLCLDLSEPPCPAGEPEAGTPHILGADGAIVPLGPEELIPAQEPPAPDASAPDVSAPDTGTADTGAADEAARIEAERQAAEEAARLQAEQEAAAAAAAEEAARQAADQAAAEEAARLEAERVAAEQAAAEEAARLQAEQEAAAEAARLEAERQAAEQAAAEEAARLEAEAAAQAAADAEAAAAAEAEVAAEGEVAPVEEPVAETAPDAGDVQSAEQPVAEEGFAPTVAGEAGTPETGAEAGTEAEAEVAAEPPATDPAADVVVAAPDEFVDPTVAEPTPEPVAATAEPGEDAATEPESVEVVTVTEEDFRSSEEDFDTTVTGEASATAQGSGNRDRGLSDLEKALLVGLGAVAVGAILRNGQEVVANSGDRVVTRDPTGGLIVYRDDDAILRQPGSTVRTETFSDGSTRTILDRPDGTQVVTIRDATGRVLRRERVLQDGTRVALIDDLGAPVAPVDVRTLVEAAPPPVEVSASGLSQQAIQDVLFAQPAYNAGRTFSLRQIREIEAVRALAPAISLDDITFATGSAAIPGTQLSNLVRVGLLMEQAIRQNPREVFLIEGHTDAVGSDAYNLALSDRRAESVALALSQNFGIPPENLVVQGYGERFLKVPTQAAEQANRRATVRRITPLLQIASN
jgi:outer membrane protein OmpA-like peptidoglycan-associated protein